MSSDRKLTGQSRKRVTLEANVSKVRRSIPDGVTAISHRDRTAFNFFSVNLYLAKNPLLSADWALEYSLRTGRHGRACRSDVNQ